LGPVLLGGVVTAVEDAAVAALSIVRYTTRSPTMVPQYRPFGSNTFPL
jgi:hypothetical protein